MQESMLNALNPSPSANIPQQLQIAAEQHQKEIDDLTLRHKEVVESLERQLLSSTNQISILEKQIKNMSESLSDKDQMLTQITAEFEAIRKDYETTKIKYNDDRKKTEEKNTLETNLTISQLNLAIEKIKSDHQSELDRQKESTENSLKDIKFMHTQEMQVLQDRVEKQNTLISTLQQQKESLSHTSLTDMQANYMKEINKMNAHLDSFKKQHEDETLSLKKQKEDALKKVASLEQELAKSKNIIKGNIKEKNIGNVKAKLDKLKELTMQNDLLQEEVKKGKKIMIQQKALISKLEGSEKKLKDMLNEKECEIEEERTATNKRIQQQSSNSDREEFEKQKSEMLKELSSKEEQIALLSRQLQSNKEVNPLSPSEDEPRTKSVRSIQEFGEQPQYKDFITLKKSEYQIYYNARQIVEHSTDVRCKNCMSWCSIESFINHIGRPCQIEEKEWSVEERLMNTEAVLKQVTEKMEKMRLHRDKVQVEMDRVALELRNSQKKYANLEEKKMTDESGLKSEIRFLLIQLGKHKVKASKNRKDENSSPDSKHLFQLERDILSVMSPNSISKSISKFVKNTPRSGRCVESQYSSQRKSGFEDILITSPPSERKLVVVPQFIKKSLMDVYSKIE